MSIDDLELGVDELARGLGYGPHTGRTMPDHVAATLDALLPHARSLLDPAVAVMTTFANLDRPRQALVCEEPCSGTLSIGSIVATQFRDARAAAIFVATIGPRLESAARDLSLRGRELEGYILDTIGSVAVESCADALESWLIDEVKPFGWGISNRFSPGYCTWETADQRALFALFAEDRPAGVTLSDTCLMSPIKSVSGVIGLGENVEHRPYPCDFCSMRNCHQRLTSRLAGG